MRHLHSRLSLYEEVSLQGCIDREGYAERYKAERYRSS